MTPICFGWQGLDSLLGKGFYFSLPNPDPFSVHTGSYEIVASALSPNEKRPRPETDHSPPSSPEEVKNVCIHPIPPLPHTYTWHGAQLSTLLYFALIRRLYTTVRYECSCSQSLDAGWAFRYKWLCQPVDYSYKPSAIYVSITYL
jgi:hypothetical protein